MAVSKSEVGLKPSATPYQLSVKQATLACTVLQKQMSSHVASKRQRSDWDVRKENLFGSSVEGESSDPETVWLLLTTKRHISDAKRLKPTKIPIPHPFLLPSEPTQSFSICLIVPDPQRLYKDVLSSPTFPESLRPRVQRVISISKLKAKYKTFEARRQLAGQHDLFLADDRIITYLPGVLGKIFYKSTSKRPVPISISGASPRGEDGKRVKAARGPQGLKKDADKSGEGLGVASPERVGQEIQKALGSAMVHLAPSASTSVRVGNAGMAAVELAGNIAAVVRGLLEEQRGNDKGTLVPQGWRNVRALHVKGPNTMSIPIWLAEELWVDEGDVLEEKAGFGKKTGKKGNKQIKGGEQDEDEGGPEAGAGAGTEAVKSITGADGDEGHKRKLKEGEERKRKAGETGKPDAAKHAKKKRKAETEVDGKLAGESRARKERLKRQKEAAMAGA